MSLELFTANPYNRALRSLTTLYGRYFKQSYLPEGVSAGNLFDINRFHRPSGISMSQKYRLTGRRLVAAGIVLSLATFGAVERALAAVASPRSASSIHDDFLHNASTPVLEPRAAIRVMIVGDSITQGREGDWTWRYRLWQWFQEQGVEVCEFSLHSLNVNES